MDPITLIVTALAASAWLGTDDAASPTTTQARESLKALAREQLAGRQGGELVLLRHEADPKIWEDPLAAELTAAGAASNPDLVAAAQALMNLVDEAGSRTGKYVIDLRGSQGIQVGDHNIQGLVYSPPPPLTDLVLPSADISDNDQAAGRPDEAIP
jgi:hypothetical protein